MVTDRKICFFNSCKSWGGGEKWHCDMAGRLSAKGYDVWVVTNPGTPLAARLEGQALNLMPVRVSKFSFLNPFKVLKLRNIFVKAGIRTIVLNLPSDLKAGGIAAKLAGIEKIIYRRGSAKPIKNTAFNRYLFRCIIDCVIANSQATRNTILKNNPDIIEESKIHIIYNGLDLGRYDALKSDPLRFRRESEIVLGTAGRLAPQKNQKFLIDVARILKQRHIDFKLLIAGEGHLHDTLKRYAMDSGVEAEIVFVGFVQNIKDLMESIDIFVLSSAWEGFGYVIVEAMASRKPVVSLNNSNEQEIIENGETGFLIENNSAEKFADKICFFIDHKSQIPIFGENGRKRVADKFTIQKALIALERLL